MAKYNKMSSGTISVLGTTIAFLVIGAICALIGFRNKIHNWWDKFGLTFLVIGALLLVVLIAKLLMERAKRM